MQFPALLLALCALVTPARAAESVALPPSFTAVQRVLFLGDSITYGGAYVDYIETVIHRRAPGWRGEIIDLGLSSETVSGLSESGHAGGKFPRPDLHERLARALAQTKPDLVLACYGMNDGIYFPLAESRFAAFRDGMDRLHAAVIATGAKLILLTPPVFDPLPIAAKILPAGLDAYPTPFAGYDEVLARYSAWLLDQRQRGWDVIDLHGPMTAALAARRQTDPKFTFSKDGIHPDAVGHAVMARAVLAAWNLRPDDDDLLHQLATQPDGALLKLIRERRKLRMHAWLTATGHKRPGVTPGLPLAEAEVRAADLTEKIRALQKRAPGAHFTGEKSVGTKNTDFTPSFTVSGPPAAFSEAARAAIQSGSVRNAANDFAAASRSLCARK